MAKKKKGEKGGAGGPERPGFMDSIEAKAEAKKDGKSSGMNPLMILLFGAVIFIMFSEGARTATGDIVGVVLNPIIGFGGSSPAITILAASIITGVSTGVIRHVMVDWIDMARIQKTMKAFQSELKEARKNENNYKVKKLTELQPELMKMQAGMSGQQFKPMGVTMVIVIPMFAWLWNFIESLNVAVINAPWGATDLLESDPLFGWLPKWILIYSLFSIPIGQLVQKGLKAWEYSRELENQDVSEVA